MTEKSAMAWPNPFCKSGYRMLAPKSMGVFKTRNSINTWESSEEGEREPEIPFCRFRCTRQCDRAFEAEDRQRIHARPEGAKCRDAMKHFDALSVKLVEAGKPWLYDFYLLSQDDHPSFFEQVRNSSYAGWKTTLMQTLTA